MKNHSQRHRHLFATHFVNMQCIVLTGCNLFVLWLLRIQKTKRGFLQHKNPLFAR